MNKLERYLSLINEIPTHFDNNSDQLTIITDKDIIENYIKEHNCHVGVMYESDYRILVVDLVKDKNNNLFTYERIINKNNGVVIIPKYNNKYILLKQYRHALREYQYAFPRGYIVPLYTSKENAIKETKEELNADINDIKYLGYFYPDSGITSNKVDVYLADILSYKTKDGYEGIENVLIADKQTLYNMIANNQINDSMTLSALMFLETKKELCK